MPKNRYNAEDIIHKLRETDVLLSQGMNISQICKGSRRGKVLSPARRREAVSYVGARLVTRNEVSAERWTSLDQ